MEVFNGKKFLFSKFYPLLALIVLALGTMPVSATVIADMDISAVRTHLDMPAQRTGTTLRHVGEGSSYSGNDLVPAEEGVAMTSDNLTNIKARSHKSSAIGRVFWRKHLVNESDMLLRVNVNDMEIGHGGSDVGMTKPFLDIEDTLSLLKEVGSIRMPQGMYRYGMVQTGSIEGTFEDGTHISGFDGLRIVSATAEHIAVAGISFPVAYQQLDQLTGYLYISVLSSFPQFDEEHLSVKIDMMPFEATNLIGSQSAIIDDGKQSLFI
jgi:hypothetical protein